jgi:peptidoglycan/xylan/chitin deacetylase (PgdA/CDA1 family)
MTAGASSAGSQRLTVLMYHSVLGGIYYGPNADNKWILSEENFAKQMKFLRDKGYETITTSQLTDFLYDKIDIPDKAVMLTFDDGYLDNIVYAYPILKEYGFTAAVFAITSEVTEKSGTVKAYPLQYLSKADMKNTSDVFEFGSHTDNMHYEERGTPRALRASKAEIRADLKKSFEYPLTFKNGIAYPYGRYNDTVVSALKAEGAQFAFTTKIGYVYKNSSPFALCRYAVTGDMSIEQFSEIVTNKPYGTARTVTASALNVRAGAGTNYRVIGLLNKGATVYVHEKTGSWSKISWQGATAYVHSDYLK